MPKQKTRDYRTLIQKWEEYILRENELDFLKPYLIPERYWQLKKRYSNLTKGLQYLLNPRRIRTSD
jgi:hypothetical protein